MKSLAFLLLLVGLASADPAKKPCDPFATVHGCDDKADAPAPTAKRPFVAKPVSGVANPSVAHTKEKCDPFSTPHGCSDAMIAQADPVKPPAAGEPPAAPPPAHTDEGKPGRTPRDICAEAMNNDPAFAASIVATADKQIDQKTIDAHKDAYAHIQKNEKHVIYAYAAMWVIAALLVGFLFLRQQALKSEIAALRRDLKAAEDKA